MTNIFIFLWSNRDKTHTHIYTHIQTHCELHHTHTHTHTQTHTHNIYTMTNSIINCRNVSQYVCYDSLID